MGIGQSASAPEAWRDLGRRSRRPHAAAAPIVGMDALVGNRAEHPPVFVRRVRHVLPERGNHVDVGLAESRLVENFGQPAAPEWPA